MVISRIKYDLYILTYGNHMKQWLMMFTYGELYVIMFTYIYSCFIIVNHRGKPENTEPS